MNNGKNGTAKQALKAARTDIQEMEDRVNRKFQEFTAAASQEVNQMKTTTVQALNVLFGNQQSVAESISKINLNLLAHNKILQRVYRRMYVQGELLRALQEGPTADKLNDLISDESQKKMHELSDRMYVESIGDCLKEVQEEIEAEREAHAAAKKEAAEKLLAENEATQAEEELKKAEEGMSSDTPPPADEDQVPVGAEVFGG